MKIFNIFMRYCSMKQPRFEYRTLGNTTTNTTYLYIVVKGMVVNVKKSTTVRPLTLGTTA